MNNGFTSAADPIDTTVNYISAGQNYATASGTTSNFDLIFDFALPTRLDGMYVWNYVYRNNSSGGTSPNSGVQGYTLTCYDGVNGTGAQIGSVLTNNSLSQARWNAVNTAETILFSSSYTGVHSVVMHVVSNYGAAGFTGLNELAFEGSSVVNSNSFTSSTNLVQHPATAKLSWAVEGPITSLEIIPDVGDVLSLTTNGVGNVNVLPFGHVEYTLRVNGGAYEKSLALIGLPEKENLHLYLLIGQSNMQGAGRYSDPILDAPDPRVLQFGSRDGMEEAWLLADHGLTALTGGSSSIGMGLEFAKTLLEDIGNTNIVIGLINHGKGSSAIQWWAPGVLDNKQNNPQTGLPYYLYDEALQRIEAAALNGVIKGVLWHQGEYNANNNSNPASEPTLYAGRLQALVDNLRTDLSLPDLPFVCGKFVPAVWTNIVGQTITFTGLPNRSTVESALADLPNQRTNTFCVDNMGLRGHDDEKIHFDAWSQRQLGQRYATAILSLIPDADEDGLLDTWELSYWGSRTNANHETTSDADAHSDLQEYIADTDPTNSASFFHITGIEITDDVQVQFDSSTNRKYILQFIDDLLGSTWSNVPGQTLRFGLGTDDVLVDTNIIHHRYYKIEASLP